MREEFEKLAAAGKIGRPHVEPLTQLAAAGYCMHRSWGFGRITTMDTVFGRFLVDFPGKAGHSMDLAFAAESLKPIPKDHILARKASDLAALRQMAALNHLDLIRLVLQSYQGRATLDQVQQVLVPDVIASDWKKWWEVAKREMKKDGHFQVPVKKTDPIIYQAQEVPLHDRVLGDLKAAKGLKARIAVASEMLKNVPDLANPQAVVNEAIALLNADIVSHQRTMPALALEGVFVRDELRAAAGVPVVDTQVNATAIWSQVSRIATVLEAVAATKQRQALQSLKEAIPNKWSEAVLGMINSVSTKLAGECAHLLIQEGRLNELKLALARLINQHAASSELLLWIAKERSDSFADILGPEVFRAALTAMERDQFNEKKSNRLGDFIMNDQELLVELIGSADLEVIKDLTRALQLSPCFDDMDKRSLLARIVKSYPTMQTLISGEPTKQEASLLVSWESLERRKNEYEELVQKKIPANSKEIAIARSYGDLRENHEYKAAKEMQKILMRRKSELEQQLVKARGVDYGSVRTDVVGIGTRVQLVDLTNQSAETFCVLGAWDSDPDNGIISYLSPMAQVLLNRKPGEEVELELQHVHRRFRIEAIEAYQPPAAGSTPAMSAPPAPPAPLPLGVPAQSVAAGV